MWTIVTNFLERVKNRLFGRTAFEKSKIGVSLITDDMAVAIDRWAALYSNRAPWLTKNNHGLGLPSAIAREIATLVTLEMQVTISDPNGQSLPDEDNAQKNRAAFIKQCFDGILPKLPVQTEYACALGGLAFKPYRDDSGIAVDFVHADDFYPVSFNSRGEIRGAIFLERKRVGNEFFTRVEKHDMTKNGYVISNQAFRSYNESDIGTLISLGDVDEWRSIKPEVTIQNVKAPLFAYFKIPHGNVVDKRSQLGVSVYSRADSAGLLEEADKQWQRFMWEYEAGEMAIDASEDAFKQVKAHDGSLIPVLPAGKERLYRMNGITQGDKTNASDLFRPYAPSLRDSNYADGLDNILKRIEDECGLARGTFSDVNETARTATELKISRQRSYATVTSIQMSLQSALNDLAKAIDALATLYKLAPDGSYSIAYVWDDSIVVDADSEREKDRTDVSDGLMLPWEYRVKWYGETEADAKAAIAELKGKSDDDLMGFKSRLKEPLIEDEE